MGCSETPTRIELVGTKHYFKHKLRYYHEQFPKSVKKPQKSLQWDFPPISLGNKSFDKRIRLCHISTLMMAEYHARKKTDEWPPRYLKVAQQTHTSTDHRQW